MIACPDCESSRAVRALVLGDNFWTNLAMLALPLLVILAVSVGLYRALDALSDLGRAKGSGHDG
jgi:hypothetical protein